jgi:hypothetical protein
VVNFGFWQSAPLSLQRDGEEISRLGLLMASFGLIPLIVGFMLVS